MSGFHSTRTMLMVMVFGAALVGLAAAVPAPGSDNVHDELTDQEIFEIFGTKPDDVPEYSVMALEWPRLQKRAYASGTHIRLNAFGRNVPLWLHPTDGVLAGVETPVYYARADRGRSADVRFDRIRDPLGVVGQMLEDKDKKATLIVNQAANGRNIVTGRIGSENWNIRPVPTRVSNRYFHRYRRFVDDFDAANITIAEFDEPHLHVIYKTDEPEEGTKYASLPIDPELLKQSRSKRSPTSTPSIVYPQILVVCDYATYERHNKDTYKLLEYLIPFWNAVDLRYRGLEFPKMRLNIAGIIIEADQNALSYIAKNRKSSDTLNIFGALEASGDFRRSIESTFPLDSSDIMVTMSPYSMCAPSTSGCTPGTLGLAYVGGACKNYNHPSPKTVSVTVIQDKGGFDGVHTAAHELGHLFGANHDGADEVTCSSHAGHIMAAHPVLTENSADWSQCSLDSFDKFFKKDNPTCLFDRPKTRSALPRVLPGRLMTMDEQCKKIEGTKTCNSYSKQMTADERTKFESEVCLRLKCILAKDNNYCTTVGDAPADGSICGDGKICLHGQCMRQADIF